jgi:hypothetical protein
MLHDAGPPRPDRPDRWRPRLPIAVAAMVTIVVAAACGDLNGTPPPAPTPIPTTSPSASPTPSPSPADVSADFIKIIAAPDFSARADITGTISFGAAAGELTGDAIFAGPSSSLTMTIAVGGATQQVQSVSIGSKHWDRDSPGPWLAGPDADPSQGSLSGTLEAIASVEDLGVIAKNGRQLHHLRPDGGGAISPATIGFDVEGATDVAFAMDFFATDDGTPTIMGLNGSWTQTEGDAVVPIDIDFEFALSEIGRPQTVSPPDDVWKVNRSKTFAYTMAHPATWTVETSKTEDAYAIDGQPYVYVAPQKLAKVLSVDEFVASLQDFYKDDFGQPTSKLATKLGGQSGSRLIYQFTNDQGQDVTFVDDVTVRGRTGWEVFLVTAGGAEDIPIFDQFIATFAFTD